MFFKSKFNNNKRSQSTDYGKEAIPSDCKEKPQINKQKLSQNFSFGKKNRSQSETTNNNLTNKNPQSKKSNNSLQSKMLKSKRLNQNSDQSFCTNNDKLIENFEKMTQHRLMDCFSYSDSFENSFKYVPSFNPNLNENNLSYKESFDYNGQSLNNIIESNFYTNNKQSDPSKSKRTIFIPKRNKLKLFRQNSDNNYDFTSGKKKNITNSKIKSDLEYFYSQSIPKKSILLSIQDNIIDTQQNSQIFISLDESPQNMILEEQNENISTDEKFSQNDNKIFELKNNGLDLKTRDFLQSLDDPQNLLKNRIIRDLNQKPCYKFVPQKEFRVKFSGNNKYPQRFSIPYVNKLLGEKIYYGNELIPGNPIGVLKRA